MIQLLYKLILTMSCVAMLTSCANRSSTVSDVEGKQSSIKTISISRTVKIVDEPFFQSPAMIWGGAIGGLIGAAIAGAISDAPTEPQKLKAFLEGSKIDVRAIVRSSLRNKLYKNGQSIRLVDAGAKADAEMQLHVALYGIHGATPFSITGMKPVLGVKAILVRPDKAIIWRGAQTIRAASSDQVASHTMDEYFAKPKLLSDGYASLSNIIADTLVTSFNKAGADGRIKW